MLNPSLGFCAAYVNQLKVGIEFPLLPLLIEILDYYKIALSQLVRNAIRVIVSFE